MNYSISRIKKSIWYRGQQILNPLAKRATNPYTTHIPILVAIGSLIDIEYALELGCGEYSTLTFLNKTVFPRLESLHSIENDSLWADKISTLAASDRRLQINLIDSAIKAAIDKSLVREKDLIFIDDSLTIQERSATIKEVSKFVESSTIVIIHDYENKDYRDSATRFANSFRFTAFNPNTGVLWNNSTLSKKVLGKLNNLFKRNQNVELSNSLLWYEKISKFLREES